MQKYHFLLLKKFKNTESVQLCESTPSRLVDFVLCVLGTNGLAKLTHSFLTAKQLFCGFFTFFYAIFSFLRPEHDSYANLTSFSKYRNIKKHFEE